MSELGSSDFKSETWLRFIKYLEDELAERRAYNEGVTLTDVETAVIRGEIKHIKKLLRLAG